MTGSSSNQRKARHELLRWAARIGAVTAEAVAISEQTSVGSARGRLLALERGGLLAGSRLLAGQPALFAVTAAGLRESDASGLEAVRVSAANAAHLIACARAAAQLSHAYQDHVVSGERELRRDERAYGRALASAQLAVPGRGLQPHRPDLVLWPRTGAALPVAVEVELTVKAPRRLAAICTAWARCRCVSGVLYLVSREAQRPLARAIAQAQGGARIAVVPLDGAAALESPIAGGA